MRPWTWPARGLHRGALINDKRIMKRLIILAVIAAAPLCAQASLNIAYGKPVTLTGSFLGSVPASSVVDGSFMPEDSAWDTGVHWTDVHSSLLIDLGGSYSIDAFTVQFDDYDIYLLEYRNGPGEAWTTAQSFGPITSGLPGDTGHDPITGGGPTGDPGFGLWTREATLAAPITASELRFSAISGDDQYAVSEIQALVTAGPEPSTMIAGGLLLLPLGWQGIRLLRSRKQAV